MSETADDAEQEENGRLQADLVLWEDADRRARMARANLAMMPKNASYRRFWEAYAARLEALANALGQKLLPKETTR